MIDDNRTLTQREEIEQWWRGMGSPLNELLEMRLIALGDGEATFEAIPSRKFYNPQQRTHGGYAATLLDSAMGCAIFSRLGKNANFGTIELKVNFVRGIFAETGRLTCTGKVIHFGRRIQTAEARIVDEAGKLYAHGSGTFMVYTE
ncbi:PaaI family thioesterase [Taklimakanibacter deserti]|uniref:PaaI family thioesterase n=1 Tax=Taklimakanibacter deserti TaxID=2267839 RepID=UPI000E653527